MEQHVSSRRRVAGGLACAAAGALALVVGVGSPAGATGGPEAETGPGWSLDDLGDRFGGQWLEAEVPMVTGRHLLDDRGTPDTGDDAYVDVEVRDGQVSWSSDDVEIGAVEVPGGDQSQLFTYGGGHGSRHGEFDWGGGDHRDRDRGDWGDGGGHGDWGDRGDRDRGDRGGFRFCWKDDDDRGHPPTTRPSHPPTTTPPTTAPPTTAPPSTAPPTTAPPETPTTAPSTTLPQTGSSTPTTQPPGAPELPQTGSTTLPLVVGGVALVAVGAAAFFGRRYLQQRA